MDEQLLPLGRSAAAPIAAGRSGFIPTLDGLRALAILLVIFRHSAGPARYDDGMTARFFAAVARTGWAGVDLFFVVSGFLITGILLDSKARPYFFRNFYVRRALRIFPPYYLLLFIALCVMPRFLSTESPGVQDILRGQVWFWTYTSNIGLWVHGGWSSTQGWLWLDHTWSLAVEEQFYFIWPLVVFLASRRMLARIAAGIVVLSPLLRFVMLKAGVPEEVVYTFTLSRFDSLAMGSLLALFAQSAAYRARAPMLVRALMVGGALVLVPVVIHVRGLTETSRAVQLVAYTGLAVLFTGVVLAAVVAPAGSTIAVFLSWAPLSFIGRYSYGIYLCHYPLEPLFLKVFPMERIARTTHAPLLAVLLFIAFQTAVSTAIAFVSYQLYERHFIGLKGRFTKSKKATAI
ncbi:MAG: acyltransferase family protein [Polyangiaceae bacterium]|jgi:peptidoglycan/LPS O-acetylase OafA/YrhL